MTPREAFSNTTSPSHKFSRIHSPAASGVSTNYRPHSLRPRTRHQLLRQPSHPHHDIHSRHRLAASLMQPRPVRPQFQHLARHHNPSLRLCHLQRLHHPLQRLRVGVIRVIHNLRPTPLQQIAALLGRAHLFQCPNRVELLHATPTPHRIPSERIEHIVTSRHPQNHRPQHRPSSRHQLKLCSPQSVIVDSHRPHRRALTRAKQYRALPHASPKLPHPFIVRIQKRNSIGRQSLHQLILRPRNPLKSILEKLQMHCGHIAHHRPVRLRNLRQRPNLPRMVHPHLEHGHLVLLLQAQQSQRQSK